MCIYNYIYICIIYIYIWLYLIISDHLSVINCFTKRWSFVNPSIWIWDIHRLIASSPHRAQPLVVKHGEPGKSWNPRNTLENRKILIAFVAGKSGKLISGESSSSLCLICGWFFEIGKHMETWWLISGSNGLEWVAGSQFSPVFRQPHKIYWECFLPSYSSSFQAREFLYCHILIVVSYTCPWQSLKYQKALLWGGHQSVNLHLEAQVESKASQHQRQHLSCVKNGTPRDISWIHRPAW